MTKGLEKLEGLEAGDTVTVKFVADETDASQFHLGLFGIGLNQIIEILSVEKKPEPLVCYLNIQKYGIGGCWDSKDCADKYSEGRLALLKITANPTTGEYSVEEVKG